MILAAGFGTRLHPLTLEIPKALVKIDGKPLIEHAICKLRNYGFNYVVINTHHFAEQIEDYFSKNDFGIEIHLLFEKEILGTGGGIKNAEKYLSDSENFLVYNTDVISDIDLGEMYNYHLEKKSFATLAIKQRKTLRPLLVNENSEIIGRIIDDNEHIYCNDSNSYSKTAFCGIHIISSVVFENFPNEKSFDIVQFYEYMIRTGKKVIGFDIKLAFWQDFGRKSKK
ncbi:MAG: nucleotidyltransferase family protein [Ignavibacteria bacterium]|nr:nucleotidyltransferase family protein [Ignavibacteria bacterium]